jgi:hypothetical protein
MTDMIEPIATDLPAARCTECDRETVHYNTFVSHIDEKRVVCWECLSREEKGFNASRGFHRTSRNGTIPR